MKSNKNSDDFISIALQSNGDRRLHCEYIKFYLRDADDSLSQDIVLMRNYQFYTRYFAYGPMTWNSDT